MTTNMLKGSCLCGGITYEISAPLKDVINCHCSMCRKAHAAAFRTRAAVKASDFNFFSGEELLTYYESSPGERRSFCRVCGAVIITKFDRHPDMYGFALGTLDTDPDITITRHIFTKYKAPWYTITDDIPRVEDMSDLELQDVKARRSEQ